METETELTNSDLNSQVGTLTTSITADSQKAWHIFALLLSLRRPARPNELASKCTLFYTTPRLIEFLCFIPNSPLHLTPNYFVTFSSTGYLAIAQFVANSNTCMDLLPRFRLWLGLRINGESRKREVEQLAKVYSRKRKRVRLVGERLEVVKKRGDGEGDNRVVLGLPCAVKNASDEAYFSDANISRDITLRSWEPSEVAFDAHKLEKAMLRTSLFFSSSNGLAKCGTENAGYGNVHGPPFLITRNEVNYESGTACQLDSFDGHGCQILPPSLLQYETKKAIPYRDTNHHNALQSPVVSQTEKISEESLARKIRLTRKFRLKFDQQMEHAQEQMQTVVHLHENVVKYTKITQNNQEKPHRQFDEYWQSDMAQTDGLKEHKQLEITVEGSSSILPSIAEDKGRKLLDSQAMLTANALSPGKNQLPETSPKSKTDQKQEPSQRLHSIDKNLENANANCSPLRKQQTRIDKKSLPLKQQLKYKGHRSMNLKEKQENVDKNRESSFNPSQVQAEQSTLPNFDPFIVEEEEGSGGYGTVYRARRKSDGVTFAIKCPHVNANRNHVHNELKMLERFGGKNFVIKYEGSFKSGSSDCLVLEHVEHDRPEVLKRDIDICELQWYGYCMFRALAGLHKQGIVHRDVKPGNFLFNRKACKGYLIDFNLAMDLNQKYGMIDKTKLGTDVSLNNFPLPRTQAVPPTKSRKIPTIKSRELAHQEHGEISKPLPLSKDTRSKIEKSKPYVDVGSRSIIKSQGADGSGITSAKEATSTKTPSVEKFREPLPCQGRKELINLVQEALQVANSKAVNVPVSKRKRVAAPPVKVDRRFVYLTPMPLHSAGGVVGGAGLLKNKGDGKNKREGPCVGTKGFRAPEVLFRSLHQGPKVDIWSAGVTLLYLLIGRTPFVGDPDQNVKEIAKLRGSEDLWEVAKLHSRESSFPADLFDIKSLPSMKLEDWCKVNTRRPDFFGVIPRSFFDLVDKCLTVNPRVRISAEEALRHEFFSPCQEALRKHRLLRQGVELDSKSSLLLHQHSQTCREVS